MKGEEGDSYEGTVVLVEYEPVIVVEAETGCRANEEVLGRR
jgi:hypothetical protein